MIPVRPAPEPPDFDSKVRKPGNLAVDEMIGRSRETRHGRPRKVIADKPEDIPPDRFPPYWREALPEMLTAYRRICAYLCFYIEPVTGSASVDHMLPKSTHWQQIYEWTNYRLACSMMNSRKNCIANVLDPFEIEPGWFELELVAFQVKPGQKTDAQAKKRILETIEIMGLNDRECRKLREDYALLYWNRDISLAFLERRAPFVALELKRQGRLNKQ